MVGLSWVSRRLLGMHFCLDLQLPAKNVSRCLKMFNSSMAVKCKQKTQLHVIPTASRQRLHRSAECACLRYCSKLSILVYPLHMHRKKYISQCEKKNACCEAALLAHHLPQKSLCSQYAARRMASYASYMHPFIPNHSC